MPLPERVSHLQPSNSGQSSEIERVSFPNTCTEPLNSSPSEQLEVEGRKTDSSSAQVVLDVIAHAKVLHVNVPGERLRRILLAPSPKIRRIMELLEIPADVFLTLPYHNSA